MQGRSPVSRRPGVNLSHCALVALEVPLRADWVQLRSDRPPSVFTLRLGRRIGDAKHLLIYNLLKAAARRFAFRNWRVCAQAKAVRFMCDAG